MTLSWLAVPVPERDWMAERRAQGLPEKVVDPLVLRRLAALLGNDPGSGNNDTGHDSAPAIPNRGTCQSRFTPPTTKKEALGPQ